MSYLDVFLTVKYHNADNLVFLTPSCKIKNNNPKKNNRLREIKGIRNVKIIDNLTSVDILRIAKCSGIFLEVFEGFLCHNLENNPYPEFVTDMLKKEIYLNHKGKICFKT